MFKREKNKLSFVGAGGEEESLAIGGIYIWAHPSKEYILKRYDLDFVIRDQNSFLVTKFRKAPGQNAILVYYVDIIRWHTQEILDEMNLSRRSAKELMKDPDYSKCFLFYGFESYFKFEIPEGSQKCWRSYICLHSERDVKMNAYLASLKTKEENNAEV